MVWGKIKISPLDAQFSNYIRWILHKGVCQRCFREFTRPSKSLHCSHYFGRRKKSVRFDPENVISACVSCHQWLGEHPYEHTNFFERRLGPTRFAMLTYRANTPKKPDYKAIKLWLDAEERAVAQKIIGSKAV